MSFPDFERIFLGKDVSSFIELPTIALLSEIMLNKINPMALTPLGALNLDGNQAFKVTSTELIRSISVQASILNLDVNTLEESNNFAALFRFGNNLGNNSPKGAEVLVGLGKNPESNTALKYWAFEGSDVSSIITQNAKGIRHLVDNQEMLKTYLNAITFSEFSIPENSEKKGSDNKTEDNPNGKIKELKNKLKNFLAKSPDSIGIKDADVILNYMQSQLDIAKQIIEASGGNQQTIEQIASQQVKPQNDYFGETFPIIAVAQEALLEAEIQDKSIAFAISKMLPDSYSNLEVKYGLMFSNVELLNRLFYLVRPEYKN